MYSILLILTLFIGFQFIKRTQPAIHNLFQPQSVLYITRRLMPHLVFLPILAAFLTNSRFDSFITNIVLTVIAIGAWAFVRRKYYYSGNIIDHLIYDLGLLAYLTLSFALMVDQSPPDATLFVYTGVFIWAILLKSVRRTLSYIHSLLKGSLTVFRSHKKAPSASKDKISQYRKAGLTDQEISHFREQMADALENIYFLKEGLRRTARLRAIEERHQTIKTLQDFFHSITQAPQRLAVAGDFLYRYLPQLNELVQSYNEINDLTIKNKETYLLLDKSAQTIEQLAEQITDEYFRFHQCNLNELDDRVKLANRSLYKNRPSSDLLQELLKEQEDQND